MQDKDILLKTKLFGFDKKGAMDYIEKIQLENEGLKRQVQDLSSKENALLKENAMLRAQLDVAKAAGGGTVEASDNLEPVIMRNSQPVEARITFEDLSAEPDYIMPYETVGRRNTSAPQETVQAATPKKGPRPGAKVVSSKNNVTKKGGKTYVSSKK